jgi:hypothetical protein
VSQTEANSFDDPHRHDRGRLAPRAEDRPLARWGPIVKRITWMILIAASFLFYYLIDKMQEAVSLLK